MKQVLYSLFISGLMFTMPGFQCDKDYPPEPREWFREELQLTPARQSYRVGDTLWLRLQTPDRSLFDTVTSMRKSTSDFGIYLFLSLVALHDAPANPVDGYGSFVLPANVTATTQTFDSRTNTQFVLGCNQAPNYNSTVGVVLQHRGIYVLDVGAGGALRSCRPDIRREPSPPVRFVLAVASTNKELYLAVPASVRAADPRAAFIEASLDTRRAFAFRVE